MDPEWLALSQQITPIFTIQVLLLYFMYVRHTNNHILGWNSLNKLSFDNGLKAYEIKT